MRILGAGCAALQLHDLRLIWPPCSRALSSTSKNSSARPLGGACRRVIRFESATATRLVLLPGGRHFHTGMLPVEYIALTLTRRLMHG